MLLRDKVVVVAGIGPGLGRSIALAAAREGADVVLAARTAARLDDVAKEVGDLGRRGLAVPTDLTDAGAAERLAEAALTAFGRVDALVYNALAMPPIKELREVHLEAVSASFDANVVAALRLTRLLVPALAESKGSVVMINSMVVRFSQRTMGPYKLAKAALLAMAQSLATELGPQGIRVNSVAPGHIWGDSLKWYFGYLAKKRGVTVEQVYAETAAAPRPGQAARARRDRGRGRCSWPPRWRGPSPASAWTSTAASTTIEPGEFGRAGELGRHRRGPARVRDPADRAGRLRPG